MILDFSKDNFISQILESEEDNYAIKFLREWFSDSERLKVKTSGSTGTPKTFEIEKKKMLNSAKMTCDFLKLKKGDKALLCLPTEYISGKMMLVRAIERGLKVILREVKSSPIRDLEEEVDFCAMTPLQVENSLDKIHKIRNLIIGGAEVSECLVKKIAEVADENKNKIFETYGMSETLSHIALKSIFPVCEDYFKVLEGVEISQDDRGCLVIFAPKFNSDKLITNDLVEIKNNGEFRFLGRIDNVINSGGAKIFPEVLEKLVKQEVANELVFVGVKDEVLGQKLVLVIEGKEDEEIKNKILNIGYEKPFHRPKEIIFIEKIPRTPNSKVSRLGLLALLNQ